MTRRGRTTVGVSRLTPEEMGTFIGAFLDGQAPPNPRADISLAALFRYAVEDLKAYYCEAFAVQPGYSTVDSTTLADWFWRATTAGRVLFAVHEVCKQSGVPGMHVVAWACSFPEHAAPSHRLPGPKWLEVAQKERRPTHDDGSTSTPSANAQGSALCPTGT